MGDWLQKVMAVGAAGGSTIISGVASEWIGLFQPNQLIVINCCCRRRTAYSLAGCKCERGNRCTQTSQPTAAQCHALRTQLSQGIISHPQAPIHSLVLGMQLRWVICQSPSSPTYWILSVSFYSFLFQSYVRALSARGHVLQPVHNLTVVTAVERAADAQIYANSDFRKGQESGPSGY